MKKVILAVLLVVSVSGQVWAASFTGFNTALSVASVKDVTLSTLTANVDATGASKVSFNVVTNYSGYILGAFGPGLVNTVQAHTLPLTVSCVPLGAAVGTYTALVDSPNTTTVVTNGAYSATPTAYDLYIKATSVATARAGYYGAYVNLKFTDGY